MQRSLGVARSTGTDSLADILERILDRGVVITGDIRIKLVDIELLTINIRLLIASVDKAREIGIDWWETNPFISSKAKEREKQLVEKEAEIEDLRRRVAQLEGAS
ncbi:MAG: gas vesicle protein [Candidatus Tectomicrobia bacterium]|nr:gas vesicle protein [Candidatus Tectomicrobia bacterium]